MFCEMTDLPVDGALKPVTFGKLPSAGNAPDGSYALIANYPAGTVKLSAPGHGYSFYSSGDNDGIEITGAKEVVFSYSVMFQAGFQFNKGGKLPGLYGGTSLDMAKSCSGGRQNDRDDCFSARLMWRTNGMGEIYNYLPSAAYDNGGYCSTPPMSVCDPTYGESIARGAFTWSSDGSWDTVAIRLKLNDANVANGEQEVFINGKSVISLKDLMISVNSETKIYGIMAQTFFVSSSNISDAAKLNDRVEATLLGLVLKIKAPTLRTGRWPSWRKVSLGLIAGNSARLGVYLVLPDDTSDFVLISIKGSSASG